MQTRGRRFSSGIHSLIVESGLVQDCEPVTRHRFDQEPPKQEQPLTQSEAEDDFDASVETQNRDQWTIKLPTMRGHHQYCVAAAVGHIEEPRRTRCASDTEHELGEGTAESQSRGCWLRTFAWWQMRGNNTRAKFGSSSGQRW